MAEASDVMWFELHRMTTPPKFSLGKKAICLMIGLNVCLVSQSHILLAICRKSLTWAGRAAVAWPKGGAEAGQCRAGDQRAHLLAIMAVAVPAAVMPGLTVAMPTAIL